MPVWLFVLCISVVVVVGWWLLPRWRYWSVFESPDTALAYFAIFVGFVILFQQITDYHQGFIYMLSSTKTKTIVDNSPIQPAILGVWRDIMIGFYWVFIAGIIFALIGIFRGTTNKAKNKDTLKDILNEIKALREDVKEGKDNGTNKTRKL